MRLKLFNWHKWAGITILTLSALRLLWRLTHRAAAATCAMPRVAAAARRARARTGCCTCCSSPCRCSAGPTARRRAFRSSWFGVLPLPDFVPVDKALAEVLKPLHQCCAFTLGALVLLHVAAALKHQFVDRDGLLRRMWPAA